MGKLERLSIYEHEDDGQCEYYCDNGMYCRADEAQHIIDALQAQVDALTKERDDARAILTELKDWCCHGESNGYDESTGKNNPLIYLGNATLERTPRLFQFLTNIGCAPPTEELNND